MVEREQLQPAIRPAMQPAMLSIADSRLLDDVAGSPPAPYTPSLNFSDARNSQYAVGTMSIGVGVN